MRFLLALLIGLTAWWPTFAFAEGAGGTYRGIASLYYTPHVGDLVLRLVRFLRQESLVHGSSHPGSRNILHAASWIIPRTDRH